MTIGWRRGDHNVEGDIVGIVGDVKSFGLDRASPPVLYAPYAQEPVSSFAMVVRSATPATSMSRARSKARSRRVDPDLPVARLETLEAHVSSSVAERRFYMVVLTIFAVVALALAAIGIFGVLSYLVSQRTREIGIRVALGAGRQSVIGMVVGQALVLVGVGIAIGSVAALQLGTYIRAMLFQLQPNDAMDVRPGRRWPGDRWACSRRGSPPAARSASIPSWLSRRMNRANTIRNRRTRRARRLPRAPRLRNAGIAERQALFESPTAPSGAQGAPSGCAGDSRLARTRRRSSRR